MVNKSGLSPSAIPCCVSSIRTRKMKYFMCCWTLEADLYLNPYPKPLAHLVTEPGICSWTNQIKIVMINIFVSIYYIPTIHNIIG